MRKADPERAEARAAAILEAALRCFARTGFSAASMRDIAAEADVSLGLLYRYYSNKAAIVSAAIDADAGEFVEALSSVSESGVSFDRLADFLGQEAKRRSLPDYFALSSEIIAEAARSPGLRDKIRQNMVSTESALGEVIGTLLNKGAAVDPKKIVTAARRLLQLVDALAFQQFFGFDPDVRGEIVSAIADALNS